MMYDDLLDETKWVNVQDPVRQMLTSMAKAIQTQAAGIRELDKRNEYLVSRELAEKLILEGISKCSSKHDFVMLSGHVESKASLEALSSLDSRLTTMYNQISRVTETLQTQHVAISEINGKLDRMSGEIESLKIPNYDQFFAYVDRQITNTLADVDRKLSIKADLRDVEKGKHVIDMIFFIKVL